MLFELTYRDNSGKLAQTNKQTNAHELMTQTLDVFVTFFRTYLRTKKNKKTKNTPNGRHSGHGVF